MQKERAEQFSREVEGYRKALLYYAKASDWKSFQARAGRLFDYVEAVEFTELERRFFRIFTPLLVVLCAAVTALFGLDLEIGPATLRMKNAFMLAALAASSFELYFYLNYRIYAQIRTSRQQQRREQFIRFLEKDFRTYANASTSASQA